MAQKVLAGVANSRLSVKPGNLATVRNLSTGAPGWVRELYQTHAPVLILAESGNSRDVWILHRGERKFIQKFRLEVINESR